MVHGYHVIWGAYGFWLPNDPRGSWSDFVRSWELARFGPATRSAERLDVDPEQWARWRAAAVQSLQFPPVSLSGLQTHAVGTGFANSVRKSHLTIWACSILPEHVHLVIARHTYKVEQTCILLKGEATKQLNAESIHPQVKFRNARGKLPSMWAERQWKVFLDSEESIEAAIQYVEENPLKEGKAEVVVRHAVYWDHQGRLDNVSLTFPQQTRLTRSQRRWCRRRQTDSVAVGSGLNDWE
jgi:REP element-mobilizing transposase RayT